jgi:ABC-type multidrug transport system fused ATPase/permease subunit
MSAARHRCPRPAPQDLTARIQPGALVVLVGPGGAGKTTLTALIARSYGPTATRADRRPGRP